MRIGMMVVTSIVGVVVAMYSSKIITASEIVAVPMGMIVTIMVGMVVTRRMVGRMKVVTSIVMPVGRVVIASPEVITMRGRIASEIVAVPVGVIVTIMVGRVIAPAVMGGMKKMGVPEIVTVPMGVIVAMVGRVILCLVPKTSPMEGMFKPYDGSI
jgi:hypothetical protein